MAAINDEDLLSLVVAIRCSDLGTVRNKLERAALDAGLRKASLGDFVLAASELISNACEHGSCAQAAVVRAGKMVRLCVSNKTNDRGAIPPPSEWVMPAPSALSGRGLAVVSALAEDTDVAWNNGRVTVTASFPSEY